MKQSKKQSFIESVINVLAGYGLAILTQLVVYPMMKIDVSISQNFHIAIWFTLVSLARSFAIRRLFNWWHHRSWGG